MSTGRHDGPDRRFVCDAVPYHEYLYRNARRLTKQRVDAEDLLQETMLKAYLYFDSFEQGSNLRAWLFRIMLNVWVDRYRTAQRRPAEYLSDEITDAQLASHSMHASAALRSAESEALTKVPGGACLALRTLSADLRTTIYYADVEGYRNTEIAKILDIPVGTVASRLHRGRRQLRELLLDSNDEPEAM